MENDDEDKSDKSSGSAIRRDWTKGSISGNLASLAWPVIVSSTVMMMGPIIDTVWIGKLGSEAVAGVGVATIVVMLVNSLIMGLFTGLRALVARFVGAGETARANHAAQQGLVIGMILSLTIAAIGFFLAETILKIWNLEPDVVTAGGTYMRIALVGVCTISFSLMTQQTMQASGDTRTPMVISIVTRLFHIALCPFLVFGWWIFPDLGVRGAALSNVISQGAAGTIGLWVLFNGQTRLRLTLRKFSMDWAIIWRMIKIGIPASLNGLHINLGNVVFMWFIAPFGTIAVAGHHIVARLDMFVIMPGIGMGMAAGILAAQNLGAGQPQRSEKTVWTAVSWLAGFMVILTMAVYFGANGIVRIFNNEPEMVDMASKFLRIQAAGYLFNGLAMIIMHVLNNVGDTLRAMIIDMTNLWGVRILLAYLLPRVTTLGVYGVRWAIVGDALSSAIMFVTYLKIGRWKYKKV